MFPLLVCLRLVFAQKLDDTLTKGRTLACKGPDGRCSHTPKSESLPQGYQQVLDAMHTVTAHAMLLQLELVRMVGRLFRAHDDRLQRELLSRSPAGRLEV